jgi:hypothetical protein
MDTRGRAVPMPEKWTTGFSSLLHRVVDFQHFEGFRGALMMIEPRKT